MTPKEYAHRLMSRRDPDVELPLQQRFDILDMCYCVMEFSGQEGTEARVEEVIAETIREAVQEAVEIERSITYARVIAAL